MGREQEKVRDARLVDRTLAGDMRAFEELMQCYQRPVFDVAFRMLQDRETSSDITQSTFLAAFEKLGTYDSDYKFFSWIYRIAINQTLDYTRRNRVAETSAHLTVVEEQTEGPDSELADKRTSVLVRKLLDDLQEDHQTVLVLRHYSELSYEEIAEVLEIPIKTVKSRLYSARQVLKSRLQESGYDL